MASKERIWYLSHRSHTAAVPRLLAEDGMQRLSRLLMIFSLLFSITAASSFAAVTDIALSSRGTWLGGRQFGAAGSYEKLQGHISFVVDPNLAQNQQIADLKLAPRDADGHVAFSSDFVVLRPLDPTKARSTVFLEILNRGHSNASRVFFAPERGSGFKVEDLQGAVIRDAFLFEQGFTVAWIGWEFDLPRDTLRLTAPNGGSGIFRESFLGDDDSAGSGLHSLAHSYCAGDSDQPAATLTVKDRFDATGQQLPRTAWAFARGSVANPIPDSCTILLGGGFTRDRLYEAIYQAAPAPVAGLGLAAVRDFVSYLKFGGIASPLREHPQTQQHVLAYGYSQSARFLRQYLYDGFNADEQGRQGFDAAFIASAGAGRGSFNHRYALPGEAGNSVMSDLRPVDLFPFTDDREVDPVTATQGGLLERATKSRTVPKIFYTYSSSEYWARGGSLTYSSVDGKHELPLGKDSRLYFFAGTPHAHAPFPPDKVGPEPGDVEANWNNFTWANWGLRALLIDLDDWLSRGIAPPASVYPHIARELVARSQVRFPKGTGLEFPSYMPEIWRMDFGRQFNSDGIIDIEPPRLGQTYVTLVPQVDADGDDLGGIRLPFMAVPLGTYTGWNYDLPKLAAFHHLAGLIGSFQPFALTKAQREQSGDSRPSIEERYRDRADYLLRIQTAIAGLLADRLVRPEDVTAIEQESGAYWDGLVTATP